jgi:4-amino-4-deoxy-L-arabinose transferase-like glycosyltransferase
MKKIHFLIILLIIFSRFFALHLSPPSPYWEEVALAYDSYSIAQTARDHHGNFLPLTAFESFGDYKPSLYFYAAVPFIKIFGLNVFAVRLPTILASIAIIFGIAILTKNLFQRFYLPKNQQAANFIYYLSLFLASISPWL